MGCSLHGFSTITVSSQLMLRHGEFEPTAVKTKEDRSKMKPHGMRDSVHVVPEYVWGDEGPVND